jgi:hypothetical protein
MTKMVQVEKSEGKRSLERSRRRWMDNIKIDLRRIGWGGMQLIDLAQDRDNWQTLVNTAMDFQILYHLRNWRLLRKGAATQSYLIRHL